MRADLFRLAFLATHGGIYADADDVCRHGIDDWLEPGVELVLLQEDLGSIGNNFMAAAPNHPFIKAVLAAITNHVLGRQGGIWFASGPGAITLSFCAEYLPTLREQRLPAGLRVIDYCHMQQRISLHLPRRYKQGDTHWSNPANARQPTYRPPLPIRSVPSDGLG
jgi:mannosyltransferase OCH1-like enzyme